MEDISNRTLAILLIAAMVVSLGGTILSLSRLSQFRAPAQQIAGLATGTGYAKINVTASTTLSMIVSTIDLGSGWVNVSQGCTNATIASSHNDTNWTAVTDICWANSSTSNAGRISISSDDIVIRNDGSVNVSVTMSHTNTTAAAFIGGAAATPLYQFMSFGNETAACDSPNNLSWNNMNSSSDIRICDMLKANNAEDEVRVAILIRIPKDATGDKVDTLTFTSASV